MQKSLVKFSFFVQTPMYIQNVFYNIMLGVSVCMYVMLELKKKSVETKDERRIGFYA